MFAIMNELLRYNPRKIHAKVLESRIRKPVEYAAKYTMWISKRTTDGTSGLHFNTNDKRTNKRDSKMDLCFIDMIKTLGQIKKTLHTIKHQVMSQ